MKKKIKTEQNIIIIMDAIKKIMTIFLGPFLTAYFISTSTNSILYIYICNNSIKHFSSSGPRRKKK